MSLYFSCKIHSNYFHPLSYRACGKILILRGNFDLAVTLIILIMIWSQVRPATKHCALISNTRNRLCVNST